MAIFRNGQFEAAADALHSLAEGPELQARLAKYYCAMSHRGLGIELLQAGQYEQAGRHFRQAISLVGNRADLAEYLLVVYARTHQFEEAAAQAELRMEADANNPLAYLHLAQAQWRSARRPLALLTLKQALRRFGDNALLHMNLGLFHAADEQWDLAQQHLQKAVECDPASPQGWKYLGQAESVRGDFYKARQAFHRACTLDGSDLVTAYQLSLSALAADKAGFGALISLPEFARPAASSQIRQLAEYVAAEPDFVKAFLAMPPSPADEDLFGILVSVLRTALAHHPRYADLHCLLSQSLERLGELEQATQSARQAVQINPAYRQGLVQLARLEERRGQAQDALDNYRLALSTGADWPDVHLAIGQLMERTGQGAHAAEHYRSALKLNRNYLPASQALSHLAA